MTYNTIQATKLLYSVAHDMKVRNMDGSYLTYLGRFCTNTNSIFRFHRQESFNFSLFCLDVWISYKQKLNTAKVHRHDPRMTFGKYWQWLCLRR